MVTGNEASPITVVVVPVPNDYDDDDDDDDNDIDDDSDDDNDDDVDDEDDDDDDIDDDIDDDDDDDIDDDDDSDYVKPSVNLTNSEFPVSTPLTTIYHRFTKAFDPLYARTTDQVFNGIIVSLFMYQFINDPTLP